MRVPTPIAALVLVLAVSPVRAQQGLDEELRLLAEEAGAPGAAWAIVLGDSVRAGATGVIEEGSSVLVSPDSTQFRIASVSKVVNAAAVARLVDEGRLDLDGDLREVIPWLGESLTLRGLLSHTAGLEDPSVGSAVLVPEEIVELDRFLRGGMPRRSTPPGQMIRYSNRGAALAGLAVARAVGSPYDEAMREIVFLPLGMEASTFSQPPGGQVARGTRCAECRPESPLWMHASPAGSMHATAEDMGLFARGVLSSEWGARLFAPLVTMHPELPGMAMGLGERPGTRHRVLVHPGGAFGIQSVIVFVPEAEAALFFAANGGGSMLTRIIEAFLESLDLAPPAESPQPRPPENAGEFAGWYLEGRAPRASLESVAALFHYATYIGSDEDGFLTRREEGSVVRYGQIGPDLFQALDGAQRMAFERVDGAVRFVHRGSAGVGFPESLERLPRWREPAIMNELLSFAGALPAVVVLAWPFGAGLIWFVRRRGSPRGITKSRVRFRAPSLGIWAACTGLAAAHMAFLLGFVAAFNRLVASGEVFLELPTSMARLLFLPYGIAMLTMLCGVLLAQSVRKPTSWWDRIALGVCTLCGLGFVVLLVHFNLLPAAY